MGRKRRGHHQEPPGEILQEGEELFGLDRGGVEAVGILIGMCPLFEREGDTFEDDLLAKADWRPFISLTNPNKSRGMALPGGTANDEDVCMPRSPSPSSSPQSRSAPPPLWFGFRRARGAERQQLRWVAMAAALVALLFLAILAAVAIGAQALPDPGAVGTAALVVLTLGISAATLRYRLYDLDRIISRTVAFALLTVLLGGGYAVVVLGLGQLAGRQSSLVVGAATLALAALFQAVRRRVQQLIDRRFNRRRYNAAQTIQAFTGRLRQQIDLDSLTAELLAVIEQTIQPTAASLWLRPATPPQEKAPTQSGVERSGV
jgi:hypothetical protein